MTASRPANDSSLVPTQVNSDNPLIDTDMPPKCRISDEQPQPDAAPAPASQPPSTPTKPVTKKMAAMALEATPKSLGSGTYTASGGFTNAE